jgi:uncharacterized protein YraI
MKRLKEKVLILAVFYAVILSSIPVHGQSTLFLEIRQPSSVHTGPETTYSRIEVLSAGTRYPLLGRNAKQTWYFINFGAGQGWVSGTSSRVVGNADAVPTLPDSTVGGLNPTRTPKPINTTAGSPSPIPAITTPTLTLPPPTATLTLTPSVMPTSALNIYIEAQGETNVRYGPGVNYPRIGTLTSGIRYPALRRHTQFPWVEIAFPPVAGGKGWVFTDAVRAIGNLQALPATSETQFGYPTLTATPFQVVTVQPISSQPISTDPRLIRMGNTLYNMLINWKFEPYTGRQGSVFVLDLTTHSAISLSPGIAYSGMSLIKIPIMVSAYRRMTNPADDQTSIDLAQMMICSSNDASNAILALAGNGDAFAGARYTTDTMRGLGLNHTFITAPFRDDPKSTPPPVTPVKTTADQITTSPDLYNQTTPADLGQLLGAVYACAFDGGGLLNATYPGAFTATECRQMIRLMSANRIGVMIEAGLPDTDGVFVAHKHGWIPQAMGDAGIVFSPGGDFVFVSMLYERPAMTWNNEFGKVSEMTRTLYNFYNPTTPNNRIAPRQIPETCTPGSVLLTELRSAELPPIK